jgi:hypothetical protein
MSVQYGVDVRNRMRRRRALFAVEVEKRTGEKP